MFTQCKFTSTDWTWEAANIYSILTGVAYFMDSLYLWRVLLHQPFHFCICQSLRFSPCVISPKVWKIPIPKVLLLLKFKNLRVLTPFSKMCRSVRREHYYRCGHFYAFRIPSANPDCRLPGHYMQETYMSKRCDLCRSGYGPEPFTIWKEFEIDAWCGVGNTQYLTLRLPVPCKFNFDSHLSFIDLQERRRLIENRYTMTYEYYAVDDAKRKLFEENRFIG